MTCLAAALAVDRCGGNAADIWRRSVVRVDASAVLLVVALLADGEVFAAVRRAAAVVAVPAVYADFGRQVADVVAPTAVLVPVAPVLETLVVIGQQQPGLLPVRRNGK